MSLSYIFICEHLFVQLVSFSVFAGLIFLYQELDILSDL